MLRRVRENGRSQPNNQSISQYKNTAETKLNRMALLSISEMIFLFDHFIKEIGKSAISEENVEVQTSFGCVPAALMS